MMPVIRISDETYRRFQQDATPFADTPESVISKALDLAYGALGEARTHDRPRAVIRTKRPRAKTPQREFEHPLLEVLYKLGGSALSRRGREVMAPRMKPILKEGDLGLVTTGETRWWSAMCWARSELVTRGLLRTNLNGARGNSPTTLSCFWKRSQATWDVPVPDRGPQAHSGAL